LARKTCAQDAFRFELGVSIATALRKGDHLKPENG